MVPLIVSFGGAIIVDSTRRGKRFPDALSKTVPTWCAVLNSARVKLFDRFPPSPQFQSAWQPHLNSHGLSTPVDAVRKSEHDQIQQQIGVWANELLSSSFDIESSLTDLKRPLKPVWISPASQLDEEILKDLNELEFCPVICLSASKYLDDDAGLDRAGGFTYIQGAGDDHEGWSKGLSPTLFWEHRVQLLSSHRTALPSLVERIILSSMDKPCPNDVDQVFEVRSTKLFICLNSECSRNGPSDDELNVVISCRKHVGLNCKREDFEKTIHMGYSPRSMRNLSEVLSRVVPDCMKIMEKSLPVRLTPMGPELDESKELLVAIALCLLVNVFDDRGLRRQETWRPKVEKCTVRHRLHWIIEASNGAINPSRSILKRVNNYLIGP